MRTLSAIESPFQRLRDLLGDTPPGNEPIDMTIGEPRHGCPAFATDIIQTRVQDFGRYPPIAGMPELTGAIAAWIEKRCGLGLGTVVPARHVLPLCGTREGLVSAAIVASAKSGLAAPAILMPNPFYQAYYAGALAAGCEPVLLPAGASTGFLPDLDALDPHLLERTAAFYLASPANPQGAIASESYLARLIELARVHRFYLFADECYSEIYYGTPPAAALGVAVRRHGGFERVLSFNSLSKRSNAPGLRSGFIAGDEDFIADYAKYRNVACPQVPMPIQYASAALWRDEGHVDVSRELYRNKIGIASAVLRNLPGYAAPEGGFFLWLNTARLGGGEAAAKTIWKGSGVKVLPGAYLAKTDAAGVNPARDFVRVALVASACATQDAVARLEAILAPVRIV